MGVCQALRQSLQSGEPVVAPLCYDPLTSELKENGRISGDSAEIKAIRDEINEVVDLPKYWALEARTVEKNSPEG